MHALMRAATSTPLSETDDRTNVQRYEDDDASNSEEDSMSRDGEAGEFGVVIGDPTVAETMQFGGRPGISVWIRDNAR